MNAMQFLAISSNIIRYSRQDFGEENIAQKFEIVNMVLKSFWGLKIESSLAS